MPKRIGGDGLLVEALARRFVPVALAAHDGTPKLRPAPQGADELAHSLAQGRVAEPELAMLRFHHLDEPLRKCHRRRIAALALPLDACEDQRRYGRKHRETTVQRVGYR